MLLETYQQSAALWRNFRITAISHDLSGQPFVAAIEGIRYPFFGVQFHPERNDLEYGVWDAASAEYSNSEDQTKRKSDFESVMNYFSLFFVEQCSKQRSSWGAAVDGEKGNKPEEFGSDAPFTEEEWICVTDANK